MQPELRGRFFLGRSFQDWAEFDQAAQWFRSAMDDGVEAGIPWAPYSAEARWHWRWLTT